MNRVLFAAFVLTILAFVPSHAQEINTSMSDRQIIANILKECREEYMRTIGACACADDRNREGTRCNKLIKEMPESFKPFCSRKDVSLREVSLYRMQNLGFIDSRCSK
jgi:hypothetical protein